ncbi:hypothetical protein ACYATO_08745 [Lactobacillaceae bacterium Melli_B3]
MLFINVLLAILSILIPAIILSIIVTGYINTFSWSKSIYLFAKSFQIWLFKKHRINEYQKQTCKQIRYDLNAIKYASDQELNQTFKNKNHANIRATADKLINESNEELFPIQQAAFEVDKLQIHNWHQAYQYLNNQMVNEIINIAQPKSTSFNLVTKKLNPKTNPEPDLISQLLNKIPEFNQRSNFKKAS